MDFRELHYIVAIAQYQSLTKAADALYITQPTLSKCLKQTESMLGQKLFNRVGKKLVITYAGERYLSYAHEILALKSNMDKELAEIDQSKEIVLRVGFSAFRGTRIILDLVPVFASLHPNIRLKLEEVYSSSFENLLLLGELDLVLFNLPIQSPKIAYEELGKDDIFLVASTKNPISEKAINDPNCTHPWLDIRHTKNDTFIMVSEKLRLHSIINTVFEEAQFAPTICFYTENLEAACLLASEDYGLTFAAASHIKHTRFNHPPALYCIGTPPIHRTLVAAYRKDTHLPNYVKDFIHMAKAYMTSH